MQGWRMPEKGIAIGPGAPPAWTGRIAARPKKTKKKNQTTSKGIDLPAMHRRIGLHQSIQRAPVPHVFFSRAVIGASGTRAHARSCLHEKRAD